MQAFGRNLLVRPFPSDEISSGGIFVPETARERSSKATVVSCGAGTLKNPMPYKPGDVVFHIKGSGFHVEHEGESLWIISDRDILTSEN